MHLGRGAAGFPATDAGTSSERRPGGSTRLGSSLLATATRLQIVALHLSSFPVVGGKSRSNCARARASAGVGGSETCTDRDALRLLTMSEGALPRPRGRMPFSPAPRRVGRSSTSREWRSGSSRGDARDLQRDYAVRRALPGRSALLAPVWESWRPLRRLRAGRDGVGVREQRPGSFLRPVRCSPTSGRAVWLPTGQPPPSSSSWAP